VTLDGNVTCLLGKVDSDFMLIHGWLSILTIMSGFLTTQFTRFA